MSYDRVKIARFVSDNFWEEDLRRSSRTAHQQNVQTRVRFRVGFRVIGGFRVRVCVMLIGLDLGLG